ncbi:MAG: DUF2147 domain-containing protein [Bacteroidales bacterium]|jgi:uncharacterized protein (DUF2147 family)|nr:DUF2147 domain-containing protein [Bacteroidales bacterium]
MKNIYAVFIGVMLLFVSLQNSHAQQVQNKPDDIVGYYLSEDPFTNKKSQVYIYKAANESYEGTVTWVEDPELQEFIGYKFLWGLKFNKQENEWERGVFKYPGKNGNFKAYMSFPNGLAKLKVRGYWGVAAFGKTLYWTREKKR